MKAESSPLIPPELAANCKFVITAMNLNFKRTVRIPA